jgi:hypothetical protein
VRQVVRYQTAEPVAGSWLSENSEFARLAGGGSWIRTFGSGPSGEADAILPVKDRPRQGGSAPPGSECCAVVAVALAILERLITFKVARTGCVRHIRHFA